MKSQKEDIFQSFKLCASKYIYVAALSKTKRKWGSLEKCYKEDIPQSQTTPET